MEVASVDVNRSFPSVTRILVAGLVGGMVLNLIDTPWSVIVMVPKMKPFLDQHGFASHALTGPWFLATHLVFLTLIAYLYALMRAVHGPGISVILKAGALMLVLNRLFGFGNVLMGIFPAEFFFGFSASMIPGTLIAAMVAGWIVDRGK